MKKYLFLIIFFIAAKGFCALPPLYQSLKELDAVLSDDRLIEELSSGEPILEIKRDDDSYFIYTNKHILKVQVVYIPTQYMGPSKFELKFFEKEEI